MEQNEGKAIKVDTIKSTAHKLYEKINEDGIDAIKSLFSKGKTLSEELKYDSNEEYLKRMIIAQLDMDGMLLTHRFYNKGFETIPLFRKESERLFDKVNSEGTLQFDDETIEELFGNTLSISSYEEYEKWKDFIYGERQSRMDDIFIEEEFKHNYEREKNPIKKFIQSFRYRKINKQNLLEDSYEKKIRDMIREKIEQNPEDIFPTLSNCHTTIEKGIVEYESLKDLEDIARMTLMSFESEKGQAIDIERESKILREEMRSTIGTTKTGREFRKKQVTLGSKSSISKRPIIQTAHPEDVPKAIQRLQAEYEKIYSANQSQEDYIREITKICADFIYVQPYEDGNKRTGICLFNSMLLSKGILPPPVSLINDEQTARAFNKVNDEHDYSMLQDIVIEKYQMMQSAFSTGEEKKKDELEDDIEK